jgi:hypothetical protein
MGDPRYQIDVTEYVFALAHKRARQTWPTTSAWLRHLLRAWDGVPLTPRIRRSKQLSVRRDPEHEAQLDRIATVSGTSLSEAFATLVERALFSTQRPGANEPTDTQAAPAMTAPRRGALIGHGRRSQRSGDNVSPESGDILSQAF